MNIGIQIEGKVFKRCQGSNPIDWGRLEGPSKDIWAQNIAHIQVEVEDKVTNTRLWI